LAHGDQDQNVRYTQFTRMKRALEQSGAKATYLSFTNEDHFLSRQADREAFFESVEEFLLEVNGPSEYMTT
jgi:dipeptidyl aminopeptidase/acylaminoacyl peptidase